MKVAIFAAVAALSLASCTTADGNASAAKAFDRVCSAEPPLYASFAVIAESRGASAKTLARAEGLHNTITNLCANPPQDIVGALVVLTASYAQFVAINAKL